MTEPTALAQLRHLYQNMVNGAVRDTASAKRIAEGLLAPAIEALERGTAPAVAGEPFCYVSVNKQGDITRTMKRKDKWTNIPLYTTPQPTQAQAGAVPLTRERVKAILTECGYDGASAQHRADFINGLRHGEAAHGIKGGQHGL